jgi:plasmid maintenance system antidote protein VapI
MEMKEQDAGRAPSEPGSREPSQQAVSAASGFDPSRAAEAFHPSEYIQDEMAARGWDKCDLAVRMGGDIVRNALALDLYFIVGPTRRNCRIGDVMAHQLGVAFDVSHQFFLNLETAWLAHPSTQKLVARDSDGSPQGRDAQRLDGEAATARAEGIAQTPPESQS